MSRALTRAVLSFVSSIAIACSPRPQDAPASNEHVRNTTALSLIGVAVADPARTWCAEFPNGAPSLENGQAVTLVFPGQSSIVSASARIDRAQTEQCHAEFPQPRWDGYRAYRLALATELSVTRVPTVALVVAGDSKWVRDDNGHVRADLDGDGVVEEAIRCAADEGEHFTIWTIRPTGSRERRGHEYFDWGVIVDPTCQPGEDGR